MKILLCFVLVFGLTTSSSIDHCIRLLDTNVFDEDYVTSIDSEDSLIIADPIKTLDRVLVCLDQQQGRSSIEANIRPNFRNLNIQFRNTSECDHEIKSDDENPRNKTILSVIAPKPFQSNSDIPMYFYETLHAYEDADAYPNGLLPHQTQWHLLKYAFTHYIKAHGWTRIAIASDDSSNSQEFENELVEEMRANKVAFNVQSCTGERCNFHRALTFLKNNGAVIIIANVDKNVRNLMKTAHRLNMTSSEYLWIVRGPFEDHTDCNVFKNYVSITLSPTPVSKIGYFGITPRVNSIWRGLELISKAVNSVMEERIDWYYRSIFKRMNDTYTHDKATAFICSRSCDFVQMLVITNSGTKYSYQKGRDAPAPMYDLRELCVLRTDSYTNPCNDNWAVLICIVWLMFILMVFMLVYFFNRYLVWT